MTKEEYLASVEEQIHCKKAREAEEPSWIPAWCFGKLAAVVEKSPVPAFQFWNHLCIRHRYAICIIWHTKYNSELSVSKDNSVSLQIQQCFQRERAGRTGVRLTISQAKCKNILHNFIAKQAFL